MIKDKHNLKFSLRRILKFKKMTLRQYIGKSSIAFDAET